MGYKHLAWFDASEYQAILYEIDTDEICNKKVAEVTYNKDAGGFVALIFREQLLRDAQINIPSKVEAMEAAMALLVANRFDRT